MQKEIENYIREQGWIFAGVSQPDHRRQWARVSTDINGKESVTEVAYEDDLVDLALEIVEREGE